MRRKIAITIGVAAVAVIASAGILLYLASIGGFGFSNRAISDPVEGTETQTVENPAPPEHPAFPLPANNTDNNSSNASAT